MTPHQLEILLHYYACKDDYNNGEVNTPAVREAIDQLMVDGLVHPYTSKVLYSITDRGNAFVEAILALPLPTQKWVMS